MPPPPLRAVFFDIDDTLFSTTEFVRRAREQAIEAMCERGLQAERDLVLAELDDVVREFTSNDGHHFDRLLRRLPASAIADTNPGVLVAAAIIAYHETKWRELRLRPEADSLLKDLAASDCIVGVITAGIASKQMEKIVRLGIDRYLFQNAIFITDEVGIAKENPKIYRHACRTVRVAVKQAVHVGDHAYRDVDCAMEAGLRAIWHTGSGKYSALTPERKGYREVTNFSELRVALADWGLDIRS